MHEDRLNFLTNNLSFDGIVPINDFAKKKPRKVRNV